MRVADVMETPARPVSADAPLADALATMIEHGVDCLVAETTDPPRKVGILTETDVLHALYADGDRYAANGRLAATIDAIRGTEPPTALDATTVDDPSANPSSASTQTSTSETPPAASARKPSPTSSSPNTSPSKAPSPTPTSAATSRTSSANAAPSTPAAPTGNETPDQQLVSIGRSASSTRCVSPLLTDVSRPPEADCWTDP
jgi:CBS domain-containing protein